MNGFGPEREQPLPLEARPIQAVALIIRNSQGLIYTNKERDTKPQLGKFRGMRSIPMETIDKKIEETKKQALERLQSEEVAQNLIIEENPRLIGVYGIGGAAAWCYEASVISQNGRNPNYRTREVGEPAWIPIDELINGNVWVREGVLEMITDCYTSATGVYRMSCKPVSPTLHELNKNPVIGR